MVLSLPSDNSGTPSCRTCPVSSLSCNLYSFSLLRCIVSELPCRPTEDCVAACCCWVAGGAVVPGRRFLKDMAWRGRLGSSEEMRLRNEDRRERMFGSISSGSSPTSQDRVRCVSSKQTLKRQYQSFLDPLVEADDEDQIDDPSHPAVKKHRLTTEQVSFLETSFEADMKLEPERKALLAKSLGLVPRQVAIWFQNRRARWKNKQLEQEHETLKAKYNTVVKENDNLLKENEAAVEENKRLMAEVSRLMILLQSSDNGCSSGVLHTLDGTRRQTSQALDSGYELQEQQQQQQAEDGYLSSGKSDLTFPTRSLDDQSEVLDSGQSYLPIARLVGATETGLEDLKVTMVCPMVTLDGSEDPFENLLNPFLIQQRAVGGLCTEDACTLFFGWEDQWAGFS